MAYRRPSYFYVGQKLEALGDPRFANGEELWVVIAGTAQSKTIKVNDIAGTEYDVATDKLWVDFQAPSGTTYTQKPKKLAKDYTEFSDEQKYLIDLMALTTHDAVVNKTLLGIDLDKYDVFEGPMWYMAVPKNLEGKVPVLMAHTDTVVKNPNETTLEYDPATKKFYSSHGLGADDRAGCWAVNQIMLKHPDKFAFCLFDKEESGCLGSKQFVETVQFKALDVVASCYISIDRKREYNGGATIATYGYDDKELNKLVTTVTGRKEVDGSITDCKQLSAKSYDIGRKVPCFNFSCGYQFEHTVSEVLYWDELVNVVEDASKLVLEASEMWTKDWAVVKKTYGGSTYYGNSYHGGNTTKSTTGKGAKDAFSFNEEEFIIVDGQVFEESDIKTLLWFFAQEAGQDYAFNTAQHLIKEYKKQTIVRLDTKVACNSIFGGVKVDKATYDKLIAHDWVVKAFDDNAMTLTLYALGNEKVTATNIPYTWMTDVMTTDALVRA